MLSDSLTLTHDSVDSVFTKVKQMNDGAERVNEATSLTEPEKLTIKHQEMNSKEEGLRDRHLVSLTRTERDSETGLLSTATVNITFTVPRNNLFSAAEIERMFGLTVDLLDSATLAKVLRGES